MDIFRGTGLASLSGQAPRTQSLGDYCPEGHRPKDVPASWGDWSRCECLAAIVDEISQDGRRNFTGGD